MAKGYKKFDLQNLPASAAEFIRLVIKRMRYRKKVRQDVQAELTAHFEDELKDCTTDEEKEQKAQKLIAEFGDVKLLGILLRRAKKRCRPLWRTIVARTFQTVGVLILCLIVYVGWFFSGKPNITVNYVEEMTHIARPVADESLNAAPLYQRAIDAYKEPPEIEREVVDPFAGMPSMPGLPPGMPTMPKIKRQGRPEIKKPRMQRVGLLYAISDKDWIGDLTEEERTLLEQWITDNARAIGFFKQASEKPHCWWRRKAEKNIVLSVLMPELAPLRNIVKMIGWQAKLKAYNGDIKGAFDDILGCCRAGSHFKGPRMLIEQLVGIAFQGLAVRNALIILDKKELNNQLLRSFQDELERLTNKSSYIVSYHVEKFLLLDFIQRCYTENGLISGHMVPGRVKQFAKEAQTDYAHREGFLDYIRLLGIAVASADRSDMTRMTEIAYNNFQKWAYKTPWQLHQEKVDLEMGIDKWSLVKKARYWAFVALIPAVGRLNEMAYRNKTGTEALITVIGLLRYKQDVGDYPENLDKLIEAGLLKALPIDPYSDQPLVYKRTDSDFLLYGFGPNFRDDGGKVAVVDGRPRKWGTKEEGDWVFWPVQKN